MYTVQSLPWPSLPFLPNQPSAIYKTLQCTVSTLAVSLLFSNTSTCTVPSRLFLSIPTISLAIHSSRLFISIQTISSEIHQPVQFLAVSSFPSQPPLHQSVNLFNLHPGLYSDSIIKLCLCPSEVRSMTNINLYLSISSLHPGFHFLFLDCWFCSG